jgi:hypothetical protein
VFLITVLDLTREELFKKFTKWVKLGTSNEGSTGGLYLCRNIIEKPRTTYWCKWGKTKTILQYRSNSNFT